MSDSGRTAQTAEQVVVGEVEYVSESKIEKKAIDFTKNLSMQVRLADSSVVTVAGEFSPGRAVFRNVPEGERLVKFGQTVFVNPVPLLDLGYPWLGRADAKVGTSKLPVNLTLTGLASLSASTKQFLFYSAGAVATI